MRGGDNRTGELFSYVDLEARVRRNHPLRAIQTIVNEALTVLEREFAALYSTIGRPPIAPEKLLRAMLLQAFYSMRSDRRRSLGPFGVLEEPRPAAERRRRRKTVAMRTRTSMARNAPTIPMLRPPIRTAGYTASAKARRRSCASSGTG